LKEKKKAMEKVLEMIKEAYEKNPDAMEKLREMAAEDLRKEIEDLTMKVSRMGYDDAINEIRKFLLRKIFYSIMFLLWVAMMMEGEIDERKAREEFEMIKEKFSYFL